MGVYVKPPPSAEDFESVPFVVLRVFWGQQPACTTRASPSTRRWNPEEPDTQPGTQGTGAAAIPARHERPRLRRRLLLFLNEGIQCMFAADTWCAPVGPEERLGPLAAAVSLRDLCWTALLSLWFVFSCLTFPTHLQDASLAFVLGGSSLHQHLGRGLEKSLA